ncbi:ABC transporter [Clostridium novyi A str. 4570]|uniref:ABC transporter n=1 Tax=Clostridium novyi A str. 4570 TaxID=1444290 RepID=A0AA88ZM51_CLONO|nr:ABC transporter [Clostridium novyi]KGN02036.1 ABC transporter [Clostridium novyi A str. 4570]
MEYMNNGGLRSIINKFLIMIVSLFVITLILKGLVFLVPICAVGFLAYKGIKMIKSKFQDVTSIKNDVNGNVDYDFSEEYDVDSKVIDVEYEDIQK